MQSVRDNYPSLHYQGTCPTTVYVNTEVESDQLSTHVTLHLSCAKLQYNTVIKKILASYHSNMLMDNICKQYTVLKIRNCSRGFYVRETLHMRSFVKIKSSRNGELTLLFTDICKSCLRRDFLRRNMYFNAIRENKILAKISEFTVMDFRGYKPYVSIFLKNNLWIST